MAKYGNKKTGKFRSILEKTANGLLEEAELEFEYEPFEVVLIPSFISDIDSMELIGSKAPKTYKLQTNKIRATKYTPDFVGSNWLMETKGMRTGDFNVRWKLFKLLLKEMGIKPYLFMPTNKKQIIQSINLIKKIQTNEDLFTKLRS